MIIKYMYSDEVRTVTLLLCLHAGETKERIAYFGEGVALCARHGSDPTLVKLRIE